MRKPKQQYGYFRVIINTTDASVKGIFSHDTLESICELGNVLKKIHERLITEGYTITDGKISK